MDKPKLAASTTPRYAVPGISSRRSACDRCRGQKLRCLRNRDDQRCRRCIRADCECVTSSIFRMRNYSGNDAAGGPKRNRSHQEQLPPMPPNINSAVALTAATPATSPSELADLLAQLADPSPLRPSTPGTSGTSGELSQHQTATTAAAPQLLHMPGPTNATGAAASDSVMTPADRLAAWRTLNPTLFNFTLFPGQAQAGMESTESLGAASDNSMISNPDQTPDPFLAGMPDFAGLSFTGCDQLTAMELELKETPSAEQGETPMNNKQTFEDATTQETQTQKLLQVYSELSILAGRLGTVLSPGGGDRQSNCLFHGRADVSLLEDILNSTDNFANVLRSMAAQSLSPPTNQFRRSTAMTSSTEVSPLSATNPTLAESGTQSPARKEGCAVRSTTSANDSVVSLSDDSSSSSQPSPISTSPTSLLDATNLTEPSTTDSPAEDAIGRPEITTQLVVLSCYIHLLRLFVVLFSHLLEYLEEVARSDDPSICPIPGLSFSRLSLQSGNLQTTLLIQIVTSHFERIEKLLGLPRDLRVSRTGQDHFGLLSDWHLAAILEVVMRKEEAGAAVPGMQPGEPGKPGGLGGIKAFRKILKKAKQLLRERIAP